MSYTATVYQLTHEDGSFVRGSTNNYRNRIKNHKQTIDSGNGDFQKHVKEHGGWTKVTPSILKQWECFSTDEQFQEEGRFIDEVYEDPLCMNMKRAGITSKSPIGNVYKMTVAGKWFYFGKTRDMYHRQASHKTKLKNANTLLYRTIRENGGWDVVAFELLKKWECSDSDLKTVEDELIRQNWDNEFLLNSIPSSTTPERERELSNARVIKWEANHPEEARQSACIRSERWRKNHPEQWKEVQKASREKRKKDPARIQYNLEYYEKNRDELNRKKREKRALVKEQTRLQAALTPAPESPPDTP